MSRRAGRARTPAAPQSPHNANPVAKGLRRTRSVRPTTVPPPLSAAGAGKVRLGDVFDLQMGKTPARARQDYWGGANKWISIADIGKANIVISKTAEGISDKAVIESGIKIVPANTLIMSFKLSIGKTAITAEPMYTNEAIMAFLPKSNVEFDLHYLYHQFSNKDWSLGSNLAVIGLTLNKKSLQEHIILSPPLPTQQRIADELDRLCALKKNAEDRLAILDQIVKSRFVEMFGDETELSKLADETELITKGTTPTSLGFSFVEEGVNFVKIETFCEDGSLLPNKVAHITEECHHALRRSQLKVNDVLFSIAGAIGRVAVVDDRILPANTNQALAIIRLRTDARLIVPYLVEVLKSEVVSRQYMAMKQGVAQLNISLKNIGDFRLPVPPLALQREFAAFVAEVDKSKLTLRETVVTLDQLYRAKLQKYFG